MWWILKTFHFCAIFFLRLVETNPYVASGGPPWWLSDVMDTGGCKCPSHLDLLVVQNPCSLSTRWQVLLEKVKYPLKLWNKFLSFGRQVPNLQMICLCLLFLSEAENLKLPFSMDIPQLGPQASWLKFTKPTMLISIAILQPLITRCDCVPEPWLSVGPWKAFSERPCWLLI